MRLFVLTVVTSLLCFAAVAQAEEVVLDETWLFHTDSADRGVASGWAAAGFDDAAWDKVKAGYENSWTRHGYYGYDGVAWYRKRISVPERFRGQFLLFECVGQSTTVYFDGKEVARHGPVADPQQRGVNPGMHPFRVRLPVDKDSILVALRVEGADTHDTDTYGPGLVGKVVLSNEVLVSAPAGYWFAPDEFVTHEQWIAALKRKRLERRQELGLDGRIYTGPFAWVARNFVQGFVFVSDTDFYDAVNHRYRIDEYLDDGVRRFGGYDNILLWHSYPNIGVDSQNQYEMLRNLPGGMPELARLVERAHARGVKVFIPYNPWDTTTQQETLSHYEALAQIVAQLKVDGVILDVTLNKPQIELREAIDRKRLGVVLQPEGGWGDEGIKTLNSSWGQFAPVAAYSDHLRGVPVSKWTEPRHIVQSDGDRWRHDRTTLLQDAFLNGTGVIVWENVFGSWNRFIPRDAAMLRRMVVIQRHFAAQLVSDDWEPLIPTLMSDVDATFWPGQDASLWTLANWSNEDKKGNVLRVVHRPGSRYYDLWRGVEIQPAIEGDRAVLALEQIEGRGLGAIVAVRGEPEGKLSQLLANARHEAETPLSSYSATWEPPAPPRLHLADKTSRVPSNSPPENMVLIPETQKFRMAIQHNLGEGSCYPDDMAADWEPRAHFMYEGGAHPKNVLHQAIVPMIPAFFMDRTLVTKRDYRRFLEATGYRPQDAGNFLKDWDWTDRKHPAPPAGMEDHPVVWVDLEDARAYLRWVNKRLPTEYEWQYAAAGTAQRRYPWGNTWQAGMANDNGSGTTPVTAFEKGRTPEGLYDMSGNVWQLTDSERDDGNRYVMLRGGSYYQVSGSPWYFDRFVDFGLSAGERSARPTDYHVKFFLMAPSADRKATIGFRGMRDVTQP